MKTQAITKYISELDNNFKYEGRLKIKYALASTLPDTAFMKFIEDEGFPEIYDNSITRRGLKNRFSCRQRIACHKERIRGVIISTMQKKDCSSGQS